MITDENIFQKGLCVSVNAGFWRGSYRLPKDKFKDLPVEEQKLVRGTFDALLEDEKKTIEEIIAYDTATRNEIIRHTIPFPIKGVYFCMADEVEWLLDYIEQRNNSERKEMIENAAEVYEKGIEKFKETVPELYKLIAHKYPTKEKFIQRFYFDFQFFQVSVPNENLDFISPEIYKKEMEKLKNTVNEVKQNVINITYTEILESIKRIDNALENEKPNQRTYKTLDKFLEKFDKLYSEFVDRDDILNMIKNVKEVISGTDAKELRNDKDAAKKFQKEVKNLVKKVEELPDVELTRAFI